MPGADIGIDLGTSNTLIYLAGKGIMLNEPSVVTVNKTNGEVIAVGQASYRMLGRTPDELEVIRPVSNGVISNFYHTQHMMKEYIHRVSKNVFFNPRVVLCVPDEITEVERRAAVDTLRQAGARRICLLNETIAAAMGAGLDVLAPGGCGVIDIGGGTADLAVLSLGDVASSRSCKNAGRAMDEAIINMVRTKHELWIGEQTAEEAKKAIGCARPPKTELEFTVRGRDVRTGLPAARVITSTEMCEALMPTVRKIGETLMTLLEDTAPELLSGLQENGMVLTGGGALLDGMDEVLSAYARLKVRCAERPMECVALGAGKALRFLNKSGSEGRGYVNPLMEV